MVSGQQHTTGTKVKRVASPEFEDSNACQELTWFHLLPDLKLGGLTWCCARAMHSTVASLEPTSSRRTQSIKVFGADARASSDAAPLRIEGVTASVPSSGPVNADPNLKRPISPVFPSQAEAEEARVRCKEVLRS